AGRILHHDFFILRNRRFNPLPTDGPGESKALLVSLPGKFGFNPLPTDGPGESPPHRKETHYECVSIRSRPMGRENPGSKLPWQFSCTRFNPLPTDGPGESIPPEIMVTLASSFQS